MSRVLPILFNTNMVRAILDGRKTVTRRVVKLPKYIKAQDEGLYTLFAEGTCYENQHMEELVDYLNPPYQPGDILYVRETWCDDRQFTHDDTPGQYFYRADSMYPKNGDSVFLNVKWRPSIHMPKEAARIWLKVRDVRVERLQEIDDKGAYDEGAGEKDVIYQIGGRVCDFAKIWNSTIKKSDLDSYGWDANPWVWVIEFERCERPEEDNHE